MKHIGGSGTARWRPQLGITGLETAIVLIAFVVVSSVFAFAALSTGLFSADKSKETIHAGLGEAQGTLEVKGGLDLSAVITTGETTTGGSGPQNHYTLTNAPVIPGSEVIKSGSTTLTLGTDYTIIYDTGRVVLTKTSDAFKPTYTTYEISSADFSLANSAGGIPVDLTPGKTIITFMDDDALISISDFGLSKSGAADSDNLLENGEVFSITVNISTGALTDDDLFIIQVKPPQGATIVLNRTVPVKIQKVMKLP